MLNMMDVGCLVFEFKSEEVVRLLGKLADKYRTQASTFEANIEKYAAEELTPAPYNAAAAVSDYLTAEGYEQVDASPGQRAAPEALKEQIRALRDTAEYYDFLATHIPAEKTFMLAQSECAQLFGHEEAIARAAPRLGRMFGR